MSTPAVFICYSHDSPEHRARIKALADRLVEDGLNVLLDQYLPPGGPPEGWATWMENSLEAADKVLVVCTQTYLRRYQKKEAPRKGKGVTWEGAIFKQALYDAQDISDKFAAVIFAPEDEAFIPSVLRERNWYLPADGAGYEQLYRFLTNQSATTKPNRGKLKKLPAEPAQLYNVPDLPPNFLPRDTDLMALKAQLLAGSQQSVGITSVTSSPAPQASASSTQRTGLHGMGGIGKTVLASALAHDPTVRAAFPDGIFWLTISQTPDLLNRQHQLAQALTGQPQVLRDLQHGRGVLGDLLRDRAALLILDDVWSADHATPFNALGPQCRLLVTTRDQKVLRQLQADDYCVDLLSQEQALELLARWAGTTTDDLPLLTATDVVHECGHLPLAIAMIGAQANFPGEQRRDRLQLMLARLREKQLGRFEKHFPEYQYPHLLRAIEVSVEALAAEKIPSLRERYLDFAVFPEDAAIPAAVLRAFWQPLGLHPAEADEVADRLRQLSLVRQSDTGLLTLHDVQRSYVLSQVGAGRFSLQERFVNAYRATAPEGWHALKPDGYAFEHLLWHLHEADRDKEVRGLLFDFGWLQARLEATDVAGVLSDYAVIEKDNECALVQSAVYLSSHAVAKDPAQLAGQLCGRLGGERTPDIEHLLVGAKAWRGAPWLQPLHANLHAPGTALFRTFQGHSDSVLAVGLSADGRRAVSGSSDAVLKVWDVESGRELRTLHGHADAVTAAELSADGRWAVSASLDRTLKLWDVASGKELRVLKGHTEGVTTAALSADERRLVSGSFDQTLIVWDLDSGRNLWVLKGHSASVRSVALSPDGRRALSGSDDGTLKIWNLDNGNELTTLKGHSEGVFAVALSADGRRAISGSEDQTLKVWNLDTAQELYTLRGHAGWVNSVALSPDGLRAVSGSSDRLLKMWDVGTGHELRTFRGHAGEVWAVGLSGDALLVASGSDDRTLKVWNVEMQRDLCTPCGPFDGITTLALTRDGRQALSGGEDNTIKVWDVQSGRELRTLGDHRGVNSVALSADGRRAVSAAEDGSLKAWDIENGHELLTLVGHSEGVNSVALSADGRRAVSGSLDQTLKVWDVESGRELRTLRGHSERVNAVALTADQKSIVSGSWDHTLRVWDMESGRELRTLKGHSDRVNAVVLSVDGRRAMSGSHDMTLRMWDLDSGEEIRTLKGHNGEVWAVAWSTDGRTAVSGSWDQTLKVWNVESAQCVATFTGEGALDSCVITCDGRTIVAGERSGRIYFLRLVMPDDPVERSARGLTYE